MVSGWIPGYSWLHVELSLDKTMKLNISTDMYCLTDNSFPKGVNKVFHYYFYYYYFCSMRATVAETEERIKLFPIYLGQIAATHRKINCLCRLLSHISSKIDKRLIIPAYQMWEFVAFSIQNVLILYSLSSTTLN